MNFGIKLLIVGMTTLLLVSPVFGAEKVAKAQIKGLDEQVQEIKSDVLSIATELNQLEEKLLYPSNTEVAVFVALAAGEKFRLDAVDVELGGRQVAHHLYSYKELEALREGGVQRIYTGNIKTGQHEIKVTLVGKSSGGSDIRQVRSFSVNKDIGPKILELSLASEEIRLKDW